MQTLSVSSCAIVLYKRKKKKTYSHKPFDTVSESSITFTLFVTLCVLSVVHAMPHSYNKLLHNTHTQHFVCSTMHKTPSKL